MEILKYLEDRARLVEKEIDRWVPKDLTPKVLSDATRHLIEAGGKRLRPCIAMAACEAVGGKPSDAIETAAALELLHNFTLIHDDIMDHDEFRRNVKTVHTVWGEPIAIIAGDALFAKVFEAVAANARRLKLDCERAIELFDTMSKASFQLCQGQVLDMIFETRDDVTEDEYMRMVSGKTGALVEAAAKVGGLLGNAGQKQLDALANYGRLIGIAFQIQDDLLGIGGDQVKFGKPIGSDIREGKRTLVLVRGLKVASEKDRDVILRALGKKDAAKEDIMKAMEVLKSTGAVDYAAERARELVSGAKSALDVLPPSEAKTVLLKLADFVIEREF